MAPPKARRRHLQKLAERRAAERRKVRRKKVTAIVVAFAVAAGGGVFAFFAFTGGKGKPVASPSATASVSPTPTAPPSPKSVACGAKKPKAADTPKETYAKPPKMTIDTSKHYTAVMKTSCGTITLALDAKAAPNTVNSIVFLAQHHFFDGLNFHRIVKDFVIQGGDPKGDGTGGPGYQTVDAPPAGTTYKKGDLAMAKSQADPPGAAGSQFFIVTGDPAPLNSSPVYALIGSVTSGLDVAVKIEQLPADQGASDGPPAQIVYIESVTIQVG